MINITLVAAVGTNGVIGLDGKIPWHHPEDLQFFRTISMNCPVIMGRRTYESLPNGLPGRHLYVLSQEPWKVELTSGRAMDCPFELLTEALFHASKTEAPRVVIAGGSEIYRLYAPFAHDAFISRVEYNGEGDTHFEELPQQFKRIGEHHLSSAVTLEQYERRSASWASMGPTGTTYNAPRV